MKKKKSYFVPAAAIALDDRILMWHPCCDAYENYLFSNNFIHVWRFL